MSLRSRSLVFLFGFLPGLVPSAVAQSTPPSGAPGQATIAVDGLPRFKTWVPAKYPAELEASRRRGDALVRMIVTETGEITNVRLLESSEPVFGEAALAAVKQWVFLPGTVDGKPNAQCIDVPFDFTPGQKPGLLPPSYLMPRPATREPAALEDAPLGEFPRSLHGRGLPGDVVFICDVGADGRPSNLRVARASHVDFVVPTLQAHTNWKFKPAQQGDLPAKAELRGQVEFGEVPVPKPAQVLAANGLTAPDGEPPSDRPMPIVVADPVFPYDLLLKGEGGTAAVELVVLANGIVTKVHVREASNEAFGAALAVAMRGWVFQAALVQGRGVEVPLLRRAEFKAVPSDITAEAAEKDPVARLVVLARAGKIAGGAGLDERLTPLYRVAPVEVTDEAGTKRTGEAVVEFVIDREGRVRLPRVISAPHESLGWAAATALSQWVFKAPKRGGEPTDVKVQIPVQF